MKNEFMGLITLFDYENVSERQVRELIQNKIYVISDYPLSTFKELPHFKENHNNGACKTFRLDPMMIYKDHLFEFNPDLIEEIFINLKNLTEQACNKKYNTINEIKNNLKTYLLRDDKIKFLAHRYQEVSNSTNLLFMAQEEHEDHIENFEIFQNSHSIKQGEWERTIKREIQLTPPILLNHFYCYGGYQYNKLSFENLTQTIDEYSDWNFLKAWVEYLHLNQLETFCKETIFEIQTKQSSTIQKNLKRTRTKKEFEKKLKDVVEKKMYNELINLLIDNKIVYEKDNQLLLKLPEEYIHLNFITFAAALSVKLLQKFIPQTTYDTTLAKIMNNTFKNIDLKSKNIGDFKRIMNDYYKRYDSLKYNHPPTRAEVYFEPLDFLN